MFAGQAVTFPPRVSEGVGGGGISFGRPVVLLGTTYDVVHGNGELISAGQKTVGVTEIVWND